MSTDDPHPYMSGTVRGFSARDITAQTGVGCCRLVVYGLGMQFDLDTLPARARTREALARLKAVVGQLERYVDGQVLAAELEELAEPPAPAPVPPPAPAPAPAAVPAAPAGRPADDAAAPPGEPYPAAPHVTGPIRLPAGPGRLGRPAGDPAPSGTPEAAAQAAVPLPAGLLCR